MSTRTPRKPTRTGGRARSSISRRRRAGGVRRWWRTLRQLLGSLAQELRTARTPEGFTRVGPKGAALIGPKNTGGARSKSSRGGGGIGGGGGFEAFQRSRPDLFGDQFAQQRGQGDQFAQQRGQGDQDETGDDLDGGEDVDLADVGDVGFAG